MPLDLEGSYLRKLFQQMIIFQYSQYIYRIFYSICKCKQSILWTIRNRQSQENFNINQLTFGNIYIQILYPIPSMEAIQTFIHSPQFWNYHGFVLSGLWLFVSVLGIFLARINKTLHAMAFFTVDVTTLFFAGSALYRVSSHFNEFGTWPVIKICHIAGGSLFLVLLILQHLGGVKALLTKTPNPQHRGFGRTLAMIGRLVAGFGWVVGGNMQNAIIVFSITAVLYVGSLFLGSQKKSEDESRQRSKSPKGKRE